MESAQLRDPGVDLEALGTCRDALQASATEPKATAMVALTVGGQGVFRFLEKGSLSVQAANMRTAWDACPTLSPLTSPLLPTASLLLLASSLLLALLPCPYALSSAPAIVAMAKDHVDASLG